MLMRAIAIEIVQLNILTAIIKCKIINSEHMNILDLRLVQQLSSTEHAFIPKVI